MTPDAKPIIFSAPMVRAILDGRKTQTRRIVKQPAELGAKGSPITVAPYATNVPERGLAYYWKSGGSWNSTPPIKLYPVGTKLWVRETFVTGFDIDEKTGKPVGDQKIWYRATDSGLTWYDPDTETTLDNPPWKPSIHMPRWASRITLEVTAVKVERLQDISEGDALAEGVGMIGPHDPPGPLRDTYAEMYRDLWNSINGPGSWDANPWVAAYTFRRVE